jgi:hypothetical protein
VNESSDAPFILLIPFKDPPACGQKGVTMKHGYMEFTVGNEKIKIFFDAEGNLRYREDGTEISERDLKKLIESSTEMWGEF